MIGLKVCWPVEGPKIYGKIVDVHGRGSPESGSIGVCRVKL